MDTQRRLLQYIKPHRAALALGMACAGITALITTSMSLILKHAFDAMADGHTGHLNFLCGLLLIVFIVKGLFSFGQSYLLSMVANRIATNLRDQIYSHLHSLSLSFFNRTRTGAIMSTLTNDVPVIQNAAMALRDVIAAPITISVSLVALFWFSPKLAVVSLIFIPFMATVISRIGKRIRVISGAVQQKLSDVTTIIEETVAGVRIIKSFATEEHEIARFSSENHRTLTTVLKAAKKSAEMRPLVDFIGAFGIALVLYLGGNYVAWTIEAQKAAQFHWLQLHPGSLKMPDLSTFKIAGGMVQGDLMAFIYLLNAMARSAGDVGGIATMRAQALAAAGRIFEEVLDVEAEVKELPDPIEIQSLEGRIHFENVTFRYSPDGPDVLKNISFDVHPGEVVALVGSTGSGKSTLVDLIPRFYDPTHGQITIDGIPLAHLKLETLRRQIGIVPQETWLFAGTLRDNIAYGNRSTTEEDIRMAAYSANASFIEGMPLKFDTVIGERGIRLSGGEKQRIAIARAILMNPGLLILDEATSSLDASSEELVQKALDELMKGRTTIVIAHRLSTIINANRILAMQDGKIVEMGSHRELIAAGGYYARLYETQLRGYE